MDQAKLKITCFIIITTFLPRLWAFECQIPREDDTERPPPVFFGTPSNVSVEGCGLINDSDTLTDSFPWDVVVYFREDSCVTPGVIVSPRSILFDLETCKSAIHSGVTVFLDGIHANYAAAPHLNTTSVRIMNETLTAVATFKSDLNKIKRSVKPVCIVNVKSEVVLLYETFLLTEDDEIVKTQISLRNKDLCVSKLKSPAHCDTFKRYPFLCVTPTGRTEVFASAEFVYTKVDGRYFLGGKFHEIYPEPYAPSTIIDLTENARNFLLNAVPDLYALQPPTDLAMPDRANTSSLDMHGCGRPQALNPHNFVSLIAHGAEVAREELHLHPWHALVEASYYDDQQEPAHGTCGGTLISNSVIITAAHCLMSKGVSAVTSLDPHEVQVTVGVYKISNKKEVLKEEMDSRQTREVKQIVIHHDYTYNAATDDIAIIIVKSAFDTSSRYVKPVCLWDSDAEVDSIAGVLGQVVGWGLDENFTQSETLRIADIPVVSHRECFAVDRPFYSDRLWYGYNFCAGNLNGSNVCNGDSGGGFILFKQSVRRYFLRGVVSITKSQSFGSRQVCDGSVYALFTDVARYTPWIMEHLSKF